MARVHGRNGALYIGLADSSAAAEPAVAVSKWNGNWSPDMEDVTAFGDLNKHNLAGLPPAEFGFEGWWDDATSLIAAARDGVARKFYAYMKSGSYFYGTGYVGIEYEVPVDGGVSIKGMVSPAGDITPISV